MVQERRANIRRKSDRLIQGTVRAQQAILDLLQGRGGCFSDALRGIQLGVYVGRRRDDRLLAETLLKGVAGIEEHLQELGIIDQPPRRVRLVKLEGKAGGKLPVGMRKVGWEMDLPQKGERYCLYLDDGRVLRTSQVVECRQESFRTMNSLYGIEVLEEKAARTVTPKR